MFLLNRRIIGYFLAFAAAALLAVFIARAQSSSSASPQTSSAAGASRAGLNVVVLDPAHGGTDPGARGVGGVRESDIVLDLATQVRRGLESQGFQVVQTRSGNDNPSFDDRSALANAQTGAIFLTLHISSTGLTGTVKVYTMPDMQLPASGGLVRWDQAQAAYLSLSRKLGDAIQGEMSQKFKGSPANVQTAFVRQLRTTAAPAVAVEISNVTIPDKAEMDRVLAGASEAIVRGVVTFRPSYVTAAVPGAKP